MKCTMSTISLVLLLSVDAPAADVVYDGRIDELVVEPLRGRSVLGHAFSRALVIVPATELRLTTSAPQKDSERRVFVPFRVDDKTAEESPSVDLSGCYYPGTDVAYLWEDFTEAYVPVDQHPWISLKVPDGDQDRALCRPVPRLK